MIHVFSQNGRQIALDVNTGNIFLFDEITASMLANFPDRPPTLEEARAQLAVAYPEGIPEATLRQAYEEMQSLVHQKMLYSPDFIDEETAGRLRARVGGPGAGLKALCLHVSHSCNLRCPYCFAHQGDYSRTNVRGCADACPAGMEGAARFMGPEVARKAVDFLMENAERESIEIDFFGGEPLLNFDVVKEAVAYGKELAKAHHRNLHFTLTTNGTLLDEEKISFLNREMHNIVISIDGRKEVHDRFRYDAAQKGSYDRILPSALKLVQEREKNPPGRRDYFIRGTFTTENLDFTQDVLHLAGLGFKRISLEPVTGGGAGYHIGREHLPAVLAEYDNLARIIAARDPGQPGFSFYHFQVNLYEGPCIYKRITACGAGFEYFAVSPEGDLYPCHQFVGLPEFKAGNIWGGIQNPQLVEEFRNTNVLRKAACQNCWAKFFCSGGCHADSYFTNNDLATPNEITCIMQRKRIECALGLEVARRIKEQEDPA
jgi:uncharacterized protein